MADSDAPKKKSKLKWVILLVLLLLLGGGGAGAWFFFLKDMVMGGQTAEGEAATEQKVEVKAGAPALGTTVPLASFTTNLADPLGQRFIRLNIEVEVADPKVGDEISRQNARIRDSILLLLASKTYADISSSESKEMLKSEITGRLNAILGSGKVHQVFITDMVVQ